VNFIFLGLGLILGRGEAYEVVSAHLESIRLLGVGATDCNDSVGAQSFRKKETEVAETADTDDTDTLAGTTAVLLQGRVESDTTTHHGGGLGRVDAVGDGEHEVGVSAPKFAVSAVRLLTGRVFAVVSTNHLSKCVRNRRSGLV
jgi:hypothetical protein